MDKPPKPPKKCPQPSSAPRSNNSTSHNSFSTPLSVQPKVPIGKPNRAGTTSRIERVGLAQGRGRDDYAKVGPRDYRNLHRLHENVTKASPVPTIGQAKSSHSYSKGDQPQLSFLSKAASPVSQPEKTFSDYDDSWMDDLPSPSALLGQKRQTDTATTEGPISTVDSLVFDKGISDVEGDGVGPSDSYAIKENPARQRDVLALSDSGEHFGIDIRDQECDNAAWNVPFLFSPPQSRIENCSQVEAESMTMLSDDAEKPNPLHMKRRAPSLSDGEISMTSPTLLSRTLKKPKIGDRILDGPQPPTKADHPSAADLPIQPPTTSKTPSSLPIPKIKPGHPAWVYDLDPAFVAEYEDCIEFI